MVDDLCFCILVGKIMCRKPKAAQRRPTFCGAGNKRIVENIQCAYLLCGGCACECVREPVNEHKMDGNQEIRVQRNSVCSAQC